jgi:hypothetical protein
MIRRIFLRSMEFELSRNAVRLRGDLQERIDQSSREFLGSFRKGVNLLTAEVTDALSSTAIRLAEAKAKGEEIAERNATDRSFISGLQLELSLAHLNGHEC